MDACNFVSFLSVFQSYQDNSKAVCNWTLYMIEKIPASTGVQTRDH